jgi:hypothetical protein
MRARSRGESALLLLDVLDVLRAKAVKYAVVGAMAGAVHGVIRASLDADAIVSLAAQEAGALSSDLTAAGFNVELKNGDFEDPISAVLVIKDKYRNRVDLLFGLKGFDREAFDRTLQVEMNGKPLQVVGREDFIAMKLYAGGPVDLRDAQQAFFVNKDAIDIPLLKKLTARFGRPAAKRLDSLRAAMLQTEPKRPV